MWGLFLILAFDGCPYKPESLSCFQMKASLRGTNKNGNFLFFVNGEVLSYSVVVNEFPEIFFLIASLRKYEVYCMNCVLDLY